jgi:23S rRNA (pseudouridine1915-N3)-methyltransferase
VRTLIVAVGTRMPQWVAEGFKDYANRMPAHERIELIEVKPEKRAPNMSIGHVLAREARRIEAALPQGCTRVILDERGRAMSSEQLAGQITRWRTRGTDIAFVIGGAEGLDASLKSTAAMALSLSPMRLPHALARVMLVEQLYRAYAIRAGHPYHRD